jgi:undecaprenyl diphosphate synthase
MTENSHRKVIRLRFSGDIAALPENIQKIIAEAEEESASRNKMQLIVAINYGGRRELVQPFRSWRRRFESAISIL